MLLQNLKLNQGTAQQLVLVMVKFLCILELDAFGISNTSLSMLREIFLRELMTNSLLLLDLEAQNNLDQTRLSVTIIQRDSVSTQNSVMPKQLVSTFLNQASQTLLKHTLIY